MAWQISANSNFMYSTWYGMLDLDQAIMKYAPNNKYKSGFENAGKQQHIGLFSGIVNAIQHGGDGLEQLRYIDLKNNKTQTLLTNAEVVHLQDVANLVNKFKYIGILGFAVAMIIFVFMCAKNITISKFKRHLYGGVGMVLLLSVAVFVVGPTKIFYLGHELVFPNNHQWFFYYEESLMSTMMKAPALFGPIAYQLLLLTVLFWMLLLYVLQQVQIKFKKV
ncbi:MAG: DUF1461 domain-containing protein [Gammaproteobacteria bacterium]